MSFYGFTDDTVNNNIIATASNVIRGINSEYTVDDFFAIYPAFKGRLTNNGTIDTITINSAGTGYSINDLLTIDGGNSAVVRVDSVGIGNSIDTFTKITGGTGYETAENVSTTVLPVNGTGATFDIVVGTDSSYLVPLEVIQMYIDLAQIVVLQARYKAHWKMCMGLFVAHFASLYLQSVNGENASANQVMASARSKGIVSSKSVHDVSVSYDNSTINNDLNGWAQWNLTIYGQQFASFAKIIGKGGMMVW